MLILKMLSTPFSAKVDLEFYVRSLPIAKPRQSRRDKFMPSRAVQVYHAWADLVRLTARKADWVMGEPTGEPVALSCTFVLPVPASWSKTKRQAAVSGDICHVTKPDLDNLIKGLKDPLSGVIWVDDRQVIEYREPIAKRYGTAEDIGAHCRIWFLGADDYA